MKKLILTAAILGLTAGVAAAETVRMGTEGAYPPYNYIDDNGQVAGFERELGDKLCEMEGLTCTWVTNDWDSIIPNLLSGNYDTIIAGMSITEEREKSIDFTQAYYPPAASAYMSMDPNVDLKGGVVAAQTGTIQAAHVAESGATLAEYATLDDTIAAVKNGEADAVFADKDALVPFAGTDGMEFVGEDVPLGKGIGIGLRKSDTALKDKFDEAISKMKADGSLNTMIKKYFGEDALTFN
ncbi:MAG: transporter substrate-binding domain-containing protein [Thioclava marina]|uniref:Amino acid ABC transporter n=1 Tax=Thioclava marina TaxID=1915077 RepID=A0ABX3MNQ9_9RHOB|nr:MULTISPECIES: transporter substrate-binding domain-containing protein [Thioclava]MBC7146669.1 transporter substrate-binding domain-containing protein [Thioclava marina]OOY13179.1 amino acid ABC transporter [Thioclava marina]OOY28891.1 amino acid ABC transporter [Thioclava sp. L04-15]TNE84702.1 MAG: transporter substrate-binding domain-containing protein [Paracoccaceae bacterium]